MNGPILFSIKICILVSLLNITLGTYMGIILSQKRSFIYRLIETLISLPLVFPPISMGFFFLLIFGREGFLGKGLHTIFDMSIIFSPVGVLFAAFISGFPLMVKSVISSASVLNKSIIEVSKLIGTSKRQLIQYIILPNIYQGVICGLTLSVARSVGEVGMTLILGGNITGRTETISLAIYNAVFDGNFTKATKLSIILAITSVIIFSIIHKYDKGEI